MSMLRRNYRTLARNQFGNISNGKTNGITLNPSFSGLDGSSQQPLEYYLGVLGKNDVFPPRTVRTDEPIPGAHYIDSNATYVTSRDWMFGREVHGVGPRPVGGLSVECFFTVQYTVKPAGLPPPTTIYIVSEYGGGGALLGGGQFAPWGTDPEAVLSSAELGEIISAASEDFDDDTSIVTIVGTASVYTNPENIYNLPSGQPYSPRAEVVTPDYRALLMPSVGDWLAPTRRFDEVTPTITDSSVSLDRIDVRFAAGVDDADYFLDFDPTEVFEDG